MPMPRIPFVARSSERAVLSLTRRTQVSACRLGWNDAPGRFLLHQLGLRLRARRKVARRSAGEPAAFASVALGPKDVLSLVAPRTDEKGGAGLLEAAFLDACARCIFLRGRVAWRFSDVAPATHSSPGRRARRLVLHGPSRPSSAAVRYPACAPGNVVRSATDFRQEGLLRAGSEQRALLGLPTGPC